MKATLKVAIVIAIIASTALLYRRLSTTESIDDGTTIDTTTADATSTPTAADASGD